MIEPASFFCLQLHADQANWINKKIMQNDPLT